ncbi:MAG: SGNH/GDSL hydrolase family protein [Planctomycetales bacterium]|nr:SGNH/GDSL hydrolase family protein [Planctomycetales bacterium]
MSRLVSGCRGNLLLITLAFCLCLAHTACADDFVLRDGDTVVFLGDSITAARSYGKMIENYTLLRFPQRKIRFINAGIGGDTAAGGLKRLERDVFAHGATVLTVAFGTNDIGWGVLADEEHKRTYLEAVRGIVTECRKRGVRVFICSAAVTGADPNTSEESFLQKMCDEGMEVSRSLGGGAIDVQRTMREIQKRVWKFSESITDPAKKYSLHVADGVHLNELGQLAMAYAILKGFGAPADVSDCTIDAGESKVIAAVGCKVSDVVRTGDQIEFTRLDEALPFNYGLFFALHFAFVPVPNELNRYLLAVKNLPNGKYDVTADERGVGTFTSQQLSGGVNIASTTSNGWEPGGPWNAQASVLLSLTNARGELGAALTQANVYIKQGDLPAELAKQAAASNERLEANQRTVAQPRPYRFVIKPVKPDEKSKT